VRLNKNKINTHRNKNYGYFCYIQERSEEFYFVSLGQMSKFRTTIEVWFENMYLDYKILCAAGLLK